MVPDQLKVPATLDAPLESEKALCAEAEFIDSEKATETEASNGTSVDRSAGLIPMTRGGGSGAVRKLELNSPLMLLPAVSRAEAATFT